MGMVVVVKRTVTVISRAPLGDYVTTDPNEAIEYEEGLPEHEKIEQFMQALEFSEPEDVTVSEEVSVEDL